MNQPANKVNNEDTLGPGNLVEVLSTLQILCENNRIFHSGINSTASILKRSKKPRRQLCVFAFYISYFPCVETKCN